MAFKLSQVIRVSLDGCSVLEIPEGEYDELPKVAVAHAKNLKAIEGKGSEVENDDFQLPKSKPEEKKAAK